MPIPLCEHVCTAHWQRWTTSFVQMATQSDAQTRWMHQPCKHWVSLVNGSPSIPSIPLELEVADVDDVVDAAVVDVLAAVPPPPEVPVLVDCAEETVDEAPP